MTSEPHQAASHQPQHVAFGKLWEFSGRECRAGGGTTATRSVTDRKCNSVREVVWGKSHNLTCWSVNRKRSWLLRAAVMCLCVCELKRLAMFLVYVLWLACLRNRLAQKHHFQIAWLFIHCHRSMIFHLFIYLFWQTQTAFTVLMTTISAISHAVLPEWAEMHVCM